MRTLITTKGAYHEPNKRTLKNHLDVCHEEGFWLDIESPDAEDFEILEHTFNFHQLAIEDVRHGNQRPKLEEYRGYSFMVMSVAHWEGQGEIEFLEYDLFLSKDHLVTVHKFKEKHLAELRERWQKNPELTRGNPQFLTYLVVDHLVDGLFPILERLDAVIDDLQDQIIERAEPTTLHTIYELKHSVTQLRQRLGNQRDLFQRLISASLEDQQQDMSIYYRDVYDHIIRQYEQVDSLRDLLTGAMDVYLSTVSNRLNQTMKALTVIASLFLPLSFLTGFYGMNFAYLTQVLEPPYIAFWIGLGTMVGATAIQLYFFRRRGWI